MFVTPYMGVTMATSLSAGASFPNGLMGMATCFCIHSVFSCAFHLQSALGGPSFDQRQSYLRTIDQCLIHMTSCVAAWAVSRGHLLHTSINVLANSACVGALVRRRLAGLPGRRQDGMHIVQCVLLYTSFIAWRGDWWFYFMVVSSYGASAVFWLKNDALHGWGHGVFHVLLGNVCYWVMKTIAA